MEEPVFGNGIRRPPLLNLTPAKAAMPARCPGEQGVPPVHFYSLALPSYGKRAPTAPLLGLRVGWAPQSARATIGDTE